MAVTGGSTIAVLAGADCDMGLVAYEMALLADRTWRALTPEPRQPSWLEEPRATARGSGSRRPPVNMVTVSVGQSH
jgi:hypothetical protein